MTFQSTDVVSQFCKVEYETEEGIRKSPPDSWIAQFESFAVKFLETMFNNVSQPSYEKTDEKVDMNEILDELTEVMRHLKPTLFAKSLPMMADLVFLKRQAITKVPNDDAMKIIMDYKNTKETPDHIQSGFDYRLTSLISFVENIRRYAEVMLNTAGARGFGHSTRRIARNLRRIERERNRKSLKEKADENKKTISKGKKKPVKPTGDGTTNKTGDGTTNKTADGTTNKTADGTTNKTADGATNKTGDATKNKVAEAKVSSKSGDLKATNKQGEPPVISIKQASTNNNRNSRQQSLLPPQAVMEAVIQKPRKSSGSDRHSGSGGIRKKSVDKDSSLQKDRVGSLNIPEAKNNSDITPVPHFQSHKGSLSPK